MLYIGNAMMKKRRTPFFASKISGLVLNTQTKSAVLWNILIIFLISFIRSCVNQMDKYTNWNKKYK